MDNTITTKQQLQNEWLTIEELKQIIDIAVDTQAKYRAAVTIPFHKVGKRILYRASEINEWLMKHKVA